MTFQCLMPSRNAGLCSYRPGKLNNSKRPLSKTVINSEMKNLSEWFFANKLSLNIKKSNYIIFTPRQRRQTLDLLLEINNHRLERVKETSFLGVILD